MFGESSMNIGASTTSLIRRASRAQSSSLIWPVRIECSGTRASGKIQCQGRVVGRDHCPADQVHLIGIVDLDTTHWHARYCTDGRDEPLPCPWRRALRTPLLVRDPLAFEPEHIVAGGKCDRVCNR